MKELDHGIKQSAKIYSFCNSIHKINNEEYDKENNENQSNFGKCYTIESEEDHSCFVVDTINCIYFCIRFIMYNRTRDQQWLS